MAGQLGAYQFSKSFTSWSKLTTKNHIGAIFQRNTQKASNQMVKLLAFHHGNTMESLISKFPTKEFDSEDEYTWDVIGSSRRNIALVEARDEDGNIVNDGTSYNIGANTAPFELVFAENWFADGEFIVGNLNEVYQFRILGEPRQEGMNWVYSVELAGGNIDGVPAERLLAGELFSKEAAFVEQELSRKAGDITFTAPTSMRNEFSTIRIYHKESGAMWNQKLAVGIPIVKQTAGRYTVDVANYWMHYVDYQVEQQFREYKNNALVFGRSNRNANGEYKNIGKSGNVIRTGAGLYEQMEFANAMFYNEFSLSLIEDALYELCAAKLDFAQREFVLHTGERGATKFSKAVKDTLSGWYAVSGNSTLSANEAFGGVQKTTAGHTGNALKAVAPQFTEYVGMNGLKLKVVVDPMYDDPVRNKVMHPEGGPAMSYRFDIFDLGSMDQPNIFKCAIKGKPEVRGYQSGLINPFTGKVGNDNMSYEEDSASIHKMAWLGICVLDPTRTMSLIPAALRG